MSFVSDNQPTAQALADYYAERLAQRTRKADIKKAADEEAARVAQEKAQYDAAHAPVDISMLSGYLSPITSMLGPLNNMLTQYTAQQQFNQDQALAANKADEEAAANPVEPERDATVNPFAPNIQNTAPMNPFSHHLSAGWGPQAPGTMGPSNSFQPMGAALQQQQQSVAGAPSMGGVTVPGSIF